MNGLTEESSSEFLYHEACEKCGSSDAKSVYDDGHSYCFSCTHYEVGTDTSTPTLQAVPSTPKGDFVLGESIALGKRKINQATAKFWNYQVGEYKGKTVQVANYKDKNGQLVSQKIRFPNKDFLSVGDHKKAQLYGQWLWRDKGKMVCVVEGELDALSLSQAFDNKWPVVSLRSGAASAKKDIAASCEWLEQFESVILMFDNDKVGQQAAIDAASVLSPSKAKIAKLPLKDASEMIQAGRVKELIDAVWAAKAFRPDGILDGADLWDVVTEVQDVESVPYPYEGLNDVTKGCRRGEITTITAGSGIGKSQLTREFAAHLIRQGQTVGYIALEESVKRTGLGLMSIEANQPLHLGTENITKEELKRAFDSTLGTGQVFLYDHWGSTDSDNLLSKIRYLVRGCSCNWIILDHLSIVVSGMGDGDERRLIDNTMTKLRSLTEELNCGMLLVSHLKRPSGDKGHENGAETSLSQLRGSAAIGQLSDICMSLERNQQAVQGADITTVRVLKNRWSGETGIACHLEYNRDTGRMTEVAAPIEAEEMF